MLPWPTDICGRQEMDADQHFLPTQTYTLHSHFYTGYNHILHTGKQDYSLSIKLLHTSSLVMPCFFFHSAKKVKIDCVIPYLLTVQGNLEKATILMHIHCSRQPASTKPFVLANQNHNYITLALSLCRSSLPLLKVCVVNQWLSKIFSWQ